METMYYYKCNKCEAVASSNEEQLNLVCISFVSHRISNLCGGAFVRITEAEFHKLWDSQVKDSD